MKIYGIADYVSDWYPKNAISAFKKYTSVEFVADAEQADVIWIFSYYESLAPLLASSSRWRYRAIKRLQSRYPAVARALLRGRFVRRPELAGKPLVASFHHFNPAKEDQFLPNVTVADRISDVVQFFSPINIEQSGHYFTRPILLMPYWIDGEAFHPLPPGTRDVVRARLGLAPDALVIGSFQRDTEIDGQPKLEKGPDRFCEVLERLGDPRTVALLTGPRRDYVERRLRQSGIKVKSLGRVPYEQMNELYQSLDYYLVTSRFEGGPQAILEAMASRTPIYSTPVGIANLLAPAAIKPDVLSMVAALRGPYPRVLDEHTASVARFECREVIGQYEAMFRRLVAGHDLRGGAH